VSDFSVESSEPVYRGRIMGLRVDEVRMPGGGTATRQVVEHVGAVGVLALDAEDRVVLIRQYRHPVGEWLIELPAGLLDVPGEPPWRSAARELHEEAGLRAERWHTLVDLRPSPGLSDEAIRVYLARDLTEVAEADRHVGKDEETDLGVHRMALDEAVAAVFTGAIENSAAVAGLLAAAYARDRAWTPLRPVDATWAARDRRARAAPGGPAPSR
jgi:8-oxo-dGTP pyrophosphatase MutT (NUDIX family)